MSLPRLFFPCGQIKIAIDIYRPREERFDSKGGFCYRKTISDISENMK